MNFLVNDLAYFLAEQLDGKDAAAAFVKKAAMQFESDADKIQAVEVSDDGKTGSLRPRGERVMNRGNKRTPADGGIAGVPTDQYRSISNAGLICHAELQGMVQNQFQTSLISPWRQVKKRPAGIKYRPKFKFRQGEFGCARGVRRFFAHPYPLGDPPTEISPRGTRRFTRHEADY